MHFISPFEIPSKTCTLNHNSKTKQPIASDHDNAINFVLHKICILVNNKDINVVEFMCLESLNLTMCLVVKI